MEFLGIGPLELVFILIIILLVVGPRDVARVARGLGSFLNRLYRSENYRLVQRASQELRNLPQRLAQEAQLDELKELEKLKDEVSIAPPADPYRGWKEPLPPANTSPRNAAKPAAGSAAPAQAESANGPTAAAQPASPSTPPAGPEKPAAGPGPSPESKE